MFTQRGVRSWLLLVVAGGGVSDTDGGLSPVPEEVGSRSTLSTLLLKTVEMSEDGAPQWERPRLWVDVRGWSLTEMVRVDITSLFSYACLHDRAACSTLPHTKLSQFDFGRCIHFDPS